MRYFFRVLWFLWLVLGGSLAGAEPALPQVVEVQAWPQADRLFHQDPRWLGGDGAYSLDLGGGRVLWLFGDSFVATPGSSSRRQAAIVRNSVAIQRGYDPASASMKFCWREQGAEPGAFIAELDKDVFYWPDDAVLLDHTLLIFLMKVRAAKNELGFETCGWGAVAIPNPEDEPEQWRMQPVTCQQNDLGVLIGSATVMRQGDYLYAMGVQEPGHAVYCVRWPVAQALRADLSEPCWWSGGRWVPQSQSKEKPTPVLLGGATEFTVHRDERLGRWVAIQTEGFGAADMAVRYGDELTGPWTPLEKFYRMPESGDERLMIYAGKCHPEQMGADWVLTYVANSFRFEHLLETPEIYYPRFVKVKVRPAGLLMQRDYYSWYSPRLKKTAEMLVFGHAGQNWLVFPTARGRFFDWENFGMIEALRHPLERGWLRLTCLDSYDQLSLYGRRMKPWIRIWKHNHFDGYVRHEVVPFVRQELGSLYLATAGASFGAYHAVNFGLRHPDAISKVVAMSGVYDLSFRLGRFRNRSVYFHSPLHYLPGLHDQRLAQMRFFLGVAAHEPFAQQHLSLAQMLHGRGAEVALDINPRGQHSWGYWSDFARRAV